MLACAGRISIFNLNFIVNPLIITYSELINVSDMFIIMTD